jgi:hypothetical protein
MATRTIPTARSSIPASLLVISDREPCLGSCFDNEHQHPVLYHALHLVTFPIFLSSPCCTVAMASKPGTSTLRTLPCSRRLYFSLFKCFILLFTENCLLLLRFVLLSFPPHLTALRVQEKKIPNGFGDRNTLDGQGQKKRLYLDQDSQQEMLLQTNDGNMQSGLFGMERVEQTRTGLWVCTGEIMGDPESHGLSNRWS